MSQIRPISFEMVLMNFFIFFDVLIFGLDIEHIFDLLDLDIIYISVFGFQGTIVLEMISKNSDCFEQSSETGNLF